MADQKPPRLARGEAETMHALLQYQRGSLVRKVAGIDEDAARWSPVGSGTSLLWLVRHMADAEVTWVLRRFAGQDPVPTADETPDGTLADAVDAYRAVWQRVDAVAFSGTGLDELCRRPDADPPVSLRWVLMHLLEETARHAGHADIIRELIDGRTGRLPVRAYLPWHNGAMSAAEIDEYLAGLEEPKRATLAQLRDTILAILPEAEQVISYNLPAFKVQGKVIAGFAAFKNHLSYLPHSGSVFPQLKDELAGYTTTSGSLHFDIDRGLPAPLVEKLIAVRLRQAFPD